MRYAVGTGRLLRLCLHLGSGWWRLRRGEGVWTDDRRAAEVQRWAAEGLSILGIALRVRGVPLAPGPLLLVCNHLSWLDILVLHAVRHCRFVSKADVRHWPLVGSLATGAGTLYIERESRRDAMRVVHRMAERLQAGDVLAVFPEGTTGDGLSLLPFHANLLQAAIASQVAVQPLALQFIDAATGARSQAASYVGDETLLGSVWRTLTARGVVASVTVGKPEHADGRDRRAWAQSLRNTVQALLLPIH
jgi:1-acyl-sn-glycerol-3-phosphate acyltransferase